MPKIVSAAEAVSHIADGAIVAVNSSSGLCCPDAVLKAMGERYAQEQHPRGLTMIHPIAAGDFYGVKGIEHLMEGDQVVRTIAALILQGHHQLSRRRFGTR
jgi:propionate CoA-transferase